MKSVILKLVFFCLFLSNSEAQNTPPKPFYPIPTENQLRWHRWNIMLLFIYLSIPLQTWRGDLAMKTQRFLTLRNWIADSGQEFSKKQE